MSSKEIAELVEKRHDNVKRTMDTLGYKGVIRFTQFEEMVKAGVSERGVTTYHVNKRDSLIVVAQLCPEFTARIVDRWQELEALHNDPMRQLADAVLLSQQVIAQKNEEIAILQRTKAQISDKKTAAAMQTASVKSREVNKLKDELGVGRMSL